MSSSSAFPNHSGGVVQVAHAGRWGAVPEGLLEDGRLSLDARAVAAWLAIKANGWQISVSALRQATGENQSRLSTHKWGRIAKELESAGYFARERTHGKNGQWIWHIVFSPIPAIPEKTEHGFPALGKAMHGKAAHKTTRPKKTPREKIPPQRQVGGSGFENLVYPKISPAERAALEGLLAAVPAELQQPLLDEVAGAIAFHKIKIGPIPFARGLAQAVSEGRFTPSLGVGVTAARQAAATAANLPTAPFMADPAAQAAGERLLRRIREKSCA